MADSALVTEQDKAEAFTQEDDDGSKVDPKETGVRKSDGADDNLTLAGGRP